MHSPAVLTTLTLAAALSIMACAGTPPPGVVPAPAEVESPHPADVGFVHGMLLHHAQALEMAGLVEGRTVDSGIARLAERIRQSQLTEMSRMRNWLEDRGQPVAAAAAHEGHGPAEHAAMPGMLTPDELRRLGAAQGAEFDRLFLEYMIRHHQGALTMVADLFAVEGAGQEPELFRLASEIDADQRAEIARMRRFLTTLDPERP